MNYETQGWHGDRFLLGNILLGVTDEKVNLTPECARVGGEILQFNSLDRWTSLSDTLFAAGREAQGFTLLSAFAAPLLAMLEDGGVTLSLISPEKHQVDMLYAGVHSVYGKQKCFNIPRSVALDKKLELLKACGSLPTVFPDLFVLDPSLTNRFIKATNEKNGVLLSSYESWLQKKIAYDDKERRVFEMHLPSAEQDWCMELRSTYHNNFGRAGETYLRYLVLNKSYFKQALDQYVASVKTRLGGRLDEAPLHRLIAAVGLAARICEKLGILHATSARMVEFGAQCLETMRAKDYESRHQAELYLKDYLTTNLDAMLVLYGGVFASHRDTVVVDGPEQTAIRYELLTNGMWFDRHHFYLWCKRIHVSGQKVLRELLSAGIIDKNRDKTRNLRSGHPHINLRPNPRVTVINVDTKHPLVVPMVKRLEEMLKIERTTRGILHEGRTPLPPGQVIVRPGRERDQQDESQK